MVEVAPLSELVLEKEAALRRWLAQQPKVVVAYSGGVDSAYLAKVAHGVLGDRALAVTGRSPSLLELELEEARLDVAEMRRAKREAAGGREKPVPYEKARERLGLDKPSAAPRRKTRKRK